MYVQYECERMMGLTTYLNNKCVINKYHHSSLKLYIRPRIRLLMPVYKHDLIPTILTKTIGLHSNKFVPFEVLTIKRLRFLIESPPSPPKQ